MVEILFSEKPLYDNETVVVMAAEITDKTLSEKGLTPDEIELLQEVAKRKNFKCESENLFEVNTLAHKIVFVAVLEKTNAETMRKLGGKLYKIVQNNVSALVYCDNAQVAYQTAFGMELGAYRFDKYFTKRKAEDLPKLESVNFVARDVSKEGFAPYASLVAGVRYARDLTNEPSNNMTPEIMSADIKRLEYLGLKVDILDDAKMRELEFNLALAVAQGSCNLPRVAVIRWNGRDNTENYDLGLVGKGVTFDSGGISLKPGAGMWDMKQDMAGAAAVVGAMKTAALQKLNANIVAVVGLVENMPSGSATRPGDVVRSMSGQTVEILNTDAEGRLVLADCLWYIQQKFAVKKVIDIATLTGAIMVALGKEMAGIMGNSQTFTDMIIKSAEESGEQVWQLPLTKAYDKMMNSSIADMKNISESRNAGSITAACFLQRYIQEGVEWVHLDIAGMDKEDKGTPLTPKGASGFGVRLFNQIMKNI